MGGEVEESEVKKGVGMGRRVGSWFRWVESWGRDRGIGNGGEEVGLKVLGVRLGVGGELLGVE